MARYFLKAEGDKVWREVGLADYIAAERRCGFFARHIAMSDPAYAMTPATASFSSSRIKLSGRTDY